MNIFFSVGEPSGDQHAAHLMQELRNRHSGARFCGYGGVRMEQTGLDSHYRLTNLAVMGILKVLPLLLTFYRLVKRAEKYFREHRPDAVVLVDFPGFNWWIARKAKAAGIPVFYYMPPQLWAWAPWRVKRVHRFVDHVITPLTFERDWYEGQGINAHYVGHPFFDEIAGHQIDESFVETWGRKASPVVAVLPGSRNQEVLKNFPIMVEIMRRLHARHPALTFLVACYRDEHRRLCLSEVLSKAPTLPVSFFTGRTPEIIEAGDLALMVSGSVSLELASRGTPAVVIYRISRVMNVLRMLLLNVPFISLPNLIAGRRILPEFISVGNPRRVISEMTDILDLWARVPAELQRVTTDIREVGQSIQQTGASARTAEFILSRLTPTAEEISLPQSRRAA